MKILKIEPGTFKLDGGAVFGIIPKTLWNNQYPADENNLCLFALRNLYIETSGKKIILDTGIGNKQSDKFFSHYYREGIHSMEKSLLKSGIRAEEITDVIITHLHFDHVGDAIKKNKSGEYVPTFPNAIYHVSQIQWDWAMNPNPREGASYLKENLLPLKQHNAINLIKSEMNFTNEIQLRIFNGHTRGLIVPFIKYKNKILVYMSDFIGLSPQVTLSWISGYDIDPLTVFFEKQQFLNEALENNYYLIFQHDFYTEACTLKMTEKGIRPARTFTLEEIL